MEDNHNIIKGVFQLIVILSLTLFFFSYFSKKAIKLKKLFPLVLFLVWIGTSIMLGLEYLFFRDSSTLFSFNGVISLLKESLPMSLIFGSLIFFIKYKYFRKK